MFVKSGTVIYIHFYKYQYLITKNNSLAGSSYMERTPIQATP